METVRKTALFEAHEALGGKVIDFAGWALPVQYEGIIEEHEAVRKAAGMFDVSHMGEVEVKGPGAFDFVQNLVTNDVATLEDNQILYAMMCYEDGGVVDDLLVYKFASDHYYLVINASNVDKDFAWMQEQAKGYDMSLENISSQVSELAIQGPIAQEILQKVVDVDLADIKFFYCNRNVTIEGAKCLVSRTGYTGEDGFEVYTDNESILKVWNAIMKVGEPMGLKPAGLGARDTLRFEATLPLYGNEIDKDITPLEAGLGFFVKLTKENFIGKEALAKQKADGLPRKTVGFEMEKGIPRHGYEVVVGEDVIGLVTTGYFSPTLKKNIGLALIDAKYGEMGSEIGIKVRKKVFPATIVSKRFYQKNYKK
ncbi:glycine cleavage system aminomethyltransferase GcvT [Fusibacter tunisiensis]|uniref:Aminomethyltransferase n=1 Tax=Fusibacter tunisiensis TaxID=1008308 RepID=A0ABS2MU55_9FIRM|nr:glycine cleavage system aminomethyltransferase GcvT [Fusibacter tunisiensis]MBM7562963.1 aminomethyltransferase [Fusibacter tunisiensis]